MVFFYSSENVSYQQRGFAYQYSLAVDKVQELEADTVIKAIKFFSYDVNVHGFPKGIMRGSALPEDTDGSMDGTYELEMAALPKLYILPARAKGMPYRVYQGEATAAAFISFIAKYAQNDLKVAKPKTLATLDRLGATKDDDSRFYSKLETEGLVKLEKTTRSFADGGFVLRDKSDFVVPKKDKPAEAPPAEEKKQPASDAPKVEEYEEL